LRGRRVVVFQDWGVGFDALERSAMSMLSLILLFAADGVPSKTIDIFNVTSGAWSTAALSQARQALAATSLPNAGIAIFAGGWSTISDDSVVD
jgi:hypothetical protein